MTRSGYRADGSCSGHCEWCGATCSQTATETSLRDALLDACDWLDAAASDYPAEATAKGRAQVAEWRALAMKGPAPRPACPDANCPACRPVIDPPT